VTDPPQSGAYRTLVVDPPWFNGKTGVRRLYPNQTVEMGYPVMTLDELLKLPILAWAAPQAVLYLWCTNGRDHSREGQPVLLSAFELVESWGFRYHTMLTWVKNTGVCPYSAWQITTEHVIVAYRGKFDLPGPMGKRRTWFEGRKGAHSTKPAEFYESILEISYSPRLDVFARAARPGFDGWGNEYLGQGE
jgi:N6-adenosine-specific RNA methylase IME4